MMNRYTGRRISELDHIAQSIGDIVGTRLASRLMRRTYGGQAADLVDHPANGPTVIRLYAAIAGAVMKWEPRVRLSRLQLYVGTEPGQFFLELEGLHVRRNQVLSNLALRLPLQLGAAA